MSIDQFKTEAAKLPAEERRELIAYLVSLARQNDGAFWEKIEGKIADRDTSRWVGEAELDAALRLNEPTA